MNFYTWKEHRAGIKHMGRQRTAALAEGPRHGSQPDLEWKAGRASQE